MGFTWQSNGDDSVDAVECDEFAQVVYEDDQVLVVHVARSMPPDRQFEDALVDVLAIHERRHAAEEAIASLADEFGLTVLPTGPDGQRALTLAPPSRGDTGQS